MVDDRLSADPSYGRPTGVRADAVAKTNVLPQTLGTRGVAIAVFNMVVGAGIFILPATLARQVGSAAPFAYLVCVFAVGAVVICFAGAGSRVPVAGGPYGFAETALGPFFGFLVGVLVWLGAVLAAAGIGAAVMDQLGSVAPALRAPAPRAALLVALYAALAAVNIRGAASGARLIGVLTLAKLLPLGVLLGVGAAHIRYANLAPTAPSGRAFGRAVLLATFAFQGMEAALGISGEVRRPSRSVPLGLLSAMSFIAVLYIGIQVVAEGVLGPALGASTAPLADAVRGVSPALGALLLAGAAVSMLGYLAGDALSAPRVIYAFARDGYLPRGLAAVGSRRHAPWAAVVAHLSIAAVLAISGAFAELAVLSSLAVAAVYIIGCVSAVVLQRRGVARAGEPLRVPGLELAAGVGVLGMLWITLQAEPVEALALGAAVLLSLVWYRVVRRPNRLGAPTP